MYEEPGWRCILWGNVKEKSPFKLNINLRRFEHGGVGGHDYSRIHIQNLVKCSEDKDMSNIQHSFQISYLPNFTTFCFN